MAISSAISAGEIALYDRQIRLWGMQAQEKIRGANILLITVKALGNEIAKNLVLAGIGSLAIVDTDLVTEADLGAQFLITQTDVGKPRAEAALPSVQKLNPRVVVTVESHDILHGEPSYLARYDMIIATDLSITSFGNYNAAARLSQRPFYAAGSHGIYGFVFADLLEHTYNVTRDKSNMLTKLGAESPTRTVISTLDKRGDNGKLQEIVTKRETYQPLILANTSPLPSTYLSSPRRLRTVTPLLPCLRALWEFSKDLTLGRPPSATSTSDLQVFTTLATAKSRELSLPPELLTASFLRSFMQNLGTELSPTCAFVGGMAAQDIVNVLAGKEQPIQNMMLFDGETGNAPVYALSPIVPAV